MTIHARSEWTQREPKWTPARRGVGDVFIHHEGGAVRGVPKDKPAVLREIEAGVLGRDGYIAVPYNLMVFNDGDIWEGRGLANEDGATIHNNPTSVSICAVGNYEREAASDALIAGIAGATDNAIVTGWTAPRPHVRPHREVFSTACPGANLFARMDDIRNAVGHPIQPAPPPEDDHMAKTFALSDNGQPQEYFWDGTFALPVDEPEKQVYVDMGIVKEVTAQKMPQAMLAAAYQRAVKLGLI